MSILLAGLCSNPHAAYATNTQWWALGTFIQPLKNAAQGEAGMRVIAPAWTAFSKGKTDAASGGHESAAANFARAIELYGPENPLSKQAYMQRAKSLRRLGKNFEAILSLSAAISLDPESPEAYWARARMHWDARDYRKALGDYETVARLSPDLVGAHLSRGESLYELRRSEQAIDAFENSIEAALKRYEAIAAHWNTSVYAKSTPGFVDTMLSLLRSDRDMTIAKAHVWLGKTHFRRSRFWAASSAYEKAITIAPDYALAYKYRGWLNEKMGYIHQAHADYKQAANLKHGDPWIMKAIRRVR